jgi:hypothetical protein
MTAFYGKYNNNSNQQSSPALDDSIEEMTSMLIDDTTINQLTGEPGKRSSQLGSAKILSQPSRQGFFHDKALPRLPRLSFDAEDNWTLGSPPAIPAAELISNIVDLTNDDDELDSCPPPVSRQPSHARKSSAPPLPRKSSKRRSRQREQKEVVEARTTTGDQNRQLGSRKFSKVTQQSLKHSLPLSNETVKAATPNESPDVSQQIEYTLTASKALKSEGDSLVMDSRVLFRRNGEKRNRVLSRMKNAITGHLHDSFRKHHNLAENEHLLDPTLSQLPDYDEELSAISAMELRINEGWYYVHMYAEGA